MELDPDDVFKDDDDSDNEFLQLRESSKEFIVYLVDASPKMFNTTSPGEDQKDETHFHIAVSCILMALKTQIINRSYDEVAICFYNTREKKNLQDLNGVFVFNIAERENLDRPTARLIKDFACIEESFHTKIGSQYGIVSGSRENSLYNALWVAQGLLRKGSAKTADKRILLFTNEDDPFGSVKGAMKTDMTRTTLQRAKDAQDLGISIELLPLKRPDEDFNFSLFYAGLVGSGSDDAAQIMNLAGHKYTSSKHTVKVPFESSFGRLSKVELLMEWFQNATACSTKQFSTWELIAKQLEDMKDQLWKRMFTKRIVRRITFSIVGGLSIELNTYALIRPTPPGTITWLDSVTNRPLKAERSFICADTGALMEEPAKRYQPYKNEHIKFSVEELSEIKRVSTGHLRLLGFKPLSCLKDYHNLKPSTFLFPSDKEMVGSTCVFIALHRSMLRLERFAVAFYGGSSNPCLVALVAQEEITSDGGQIEPPGMHMIYLPYADDIRHVEEHHSDANAVAPRATDEQIKTAAALIKRVDLRDFSVCQFANPALQRHYEVLQALALDEDELPEIKDETLPDEGGFSRPGIVKAIEEFKLSVYGDNYEEESNFTASGTVSDTSKKRKAAAEDASKKSAYYDWGNLADNGQLKDLTVAELKYYLTAHNLSTTGKKEVLIGRILTHMGK